GAACAGPPPADRGGPAPPRGGAAGPPPRSCRYDQCRWYRPAGGPRDSRRPVAPDANHDHHFPWQPFVSLASIRRSRPGGQSDCRQRDIGTYVLWNGYFPPTARAPLPRNVPAMDPHIIPVLV